MHVQIQFAPCRIRSGRGRSVSVLVFALFASERSFLFAGFFKRLHRPIFPLSSGLPI